MKKIMLGLAAAAFSTVAAFAADVKPAVVYDMGGKNDKSFNEAAYTGAEKFKAETGVDYRDFEIQNDAQREQAMRRFAQEGYNPVVAIGFSQAAALEKVAKEFPDTKFAIVDMVVEQPNVRSILFSEEQGSYLVGVMAAKASKTGKVGFVGGMDIPLIRKFACGYVQGVKATNPDAEVFQNMTGTTPAAWGDPVKGGELAKSQIDRGADVVYHAAGGTGIGVLQAAADANVLGIGVDSNQNGMHPGKVLTSMLKRVDTAVYDAFKDVQDDTWTAGFDVKDLAAEGVGYAMDENNKDLVTADIQSAVDAASAGIKDGSIKVHNFMDDSACPVQ
ncbi:BMP family ABC transporter substrate-binding protein [Rhizobiaceae bacterium]|nr:BMP family ABC transporter substrate-binding protein [Rhizobiaceae bacterium]